MAPIRVGLILVSLSVACGRGETPFEPGLEPLDTMAVEAPSGLEESFNLDLDDSGEYLVGHLRGHIHADLATVWHAFQQADVVVNRRRMKSWEPRYDVEPAYDFSMAIDLEVDDTVTVRWTESWRHGAVGDVEAPDKVSMRWQKTEGSNLIDILRGSVALYPTEDEGITEVQMIEHLQAPLADLEEVEGLLTDVFNDALAHSHGEELPTYQD